MFEFVTFPNGRLVNGVKIKPDFCAIGIASISGNGWRVRSIREIHLKWKHWILWIWGAKRGQMVRISLGRGTNKIDRNTNCEVIWIPILIPVTNLAAKYRKSSRFSFDKSKTRVSINSKCWQQKSNFITKANPFGSFNTNPLRVLLPWGTLCPAELIATNWSKTTPVDHVASLK